MKKKLFTIAIALCMVFTMIPRGVFQIETAWATEHTDHCICGGSRSSGDHTEHTDITDWKEWTETTCLPNKAGSYYLTQNVEISEAWKPADGTVLCLNGYSITCNEGEDGKLVSTIIVDSNVTFTLIDCSKEASGNSTGKITHGIGSDNSRHRGAGVDVKAKATFNMYGGNISENESNGEGGVNVDPGAVFNMYGGSIANNTALNTTGNGGGVSNSGTFTMTGGTISGNKGGVNNGGGGGGVGNYGTFTMSGTAVIGGTKAEDANTGCNGGGVYNNSNSTFNFNGGAIIGNEASKNGGGVYNYNRGTFTMNGGSIKKNKAKNGGGVAVNYSATFTMNGGTIGDTNSNDGNIVTNEGGGVCVLSGIFNMKTGNIIGNTAVGSKADEYRGWGGGVYVSTGTFTMTGGTISNNRAIKEQGIAGALGAGGGVYNNRSGTFTMSGGNISNNISDSHGGGVYNSGTFTMSDIAAISGNTVTNETCYGGGVVNYSSFTMNGGTIGGLNGDDANTAGFGGGLYHGDGEAQLNGGMIQGNIAAKSGGGVFYTKNITLKNVTITGNTANEDGGGAWMGFVDDAVMTVGGTTTITDNKDKDGKANNVHLRTNKSLTADQSLSDPARIGITTPTSNEKTLVQNSTDTKVFTSDMSGYKLVTDGEGGLKLAVDDGSTPTEHEHCICGSTHKNIGDHDAEVSTTFAKKIWMENGNLKIDGENWEKTSFLGVDNEYHEAYNLGAGDYYLGSDIQPDDNIRITDGTVKLCLNGKNITINGDVEGITVGKNETSVVNFILTDCKTGNAQGEITHAAGKESRGVYIYHKCQFDMYGGSITGNTLNAAGGGAGVGASGTFNMYGGSISNNIARNEAEYGGGVFVGGSGQFNMYGGSITGNTSTTGGGVFVNVNGAGTSIGKFNISGNVNITNNKTEGKDDNVCLEKSNDGNKTASINIAGTLDAAAKIGVTTAKKPTDAPLLIVTNADENTNYDGIITSDDTQYEITRDTNVKTNLVLKKIETPAQKHRVTITAGEGMTTTGNASQTDLTGAMTDVVYTAADGYYFPESYSVADTNGIKVTRNNETQITVSGTPTADTTIKLPAATKKVTIIFDANGGWFTSATHIKSTVKFKVGEIITVPTYAAIKSDKKYNYEFVGWYTEKEGGTLLDDNTKATADATYYAHWTQTPKVYKIEYVPDGGTINDTNYKTTYTWEDKIINLPTNVTKDGYEFIGWRINSGTGDLYGSEWEVNENNLRNLTFYVCWTKKSTETTYEITFDANGGTVNPASATTAADGKLASLPTPARDGYTFNGWYTAATSGEKIEDGHKFTAKTTLYAQWTKKSSSSGSGGSSIQRPTIVTDDGGDAKLSYNGRTLTIAAKDGYEITDVLVNGVSKGAVTELTGLRTSDKVEVKTAKKAEPADPAADKNAKLIKGVENTTIALKSKLTKNGKVLLTWTKSKGYKVDRFEIYRSVKKSSGYGRKAFFTTKDGSWSKYLNTKALKTGKTYYYKLRGVRVIDGQKYYTQWSNKAWRTIK